MICCSVLGDEAGESSPIQCRKLADVGPASLLNGRPARLGKRIKLISCLLGTFAPPRLAQLLFASGQTVPPLWVYEIRGEEPRAAQLPVAIFSW